MEHKARGSLNNRETVNTNFVDDIECNEWLAEIGLEQYTETFVVNFSIGGGLLSRKRLARVRLRDFSAMNIENYSHQKLLLNHIRHSFQYAFRNLARKTDYIDKYGNDVPEDAVLEV